MVSTLLTIETSQREASVALSLTNGKTDFEPLRASVRHEDDLIPAIDRVFMRNNLAPRNLTAVAVSIGPGGFTGLRIAVSAAKMFAESLGAKIVAVPSALVAADPIESAGPIIVCLASKRDSTWATRLERESDTWQIVGSPGIVSASDLDLAGVQCVVADDYLPTSIRTCIEQSPCSFAQLSLDARACLEVAQHMLGADQTTDALALSPIYARPPEAVRLWTASKQA